MLNLDADIHVPTIKEKEVRSHEFEWQEAHEINLRETMKMT